MNFNSHISFYAEKRLFNFGYYREEKKYSLKNRAYFDGNWPNNGIVTEKVSLKTRAHTIPCVLFFMNTKDIYERRFFTFPPLLSNFAFVAVKTEYTLFTTQVIALDKIGNKSSTTNSDLMAGWLADWMDGWMLNLYCHQNAHNKMNTTHTYTHLLSELCTLDMPNAHNA